MFVACPPWGEDAIAGLFAVNLSAVKAASGDVKASMRYRFLKIKAAAESHRAMW
jgi:hypothetical protein